MSQGWRTTGLGHRGRPTFLSQPPFGTVGAQVPCNDVLAASTSPLPVSDVTRR
jgi:hypothetical protein